MEINDQIITFETYYDPMLAHIVRSRLEDNGVACFIADENMIGINPLYNNALGGIKLKIFERDLEKCRAILAQDQTIPADEHVEIDDETQGIVICPYCGSTNVRYGAATKNRFGWLSILVSLVLSVYPFSTRKAWHCFNCSEDFD
ncbi:putative signal transducing protein [Mucilaginibacter paludis]|uniref:DUF2007 domain-containing protein n=1 Tax=Mucilaginibacter paludis DSM 18603 TaxID=714943 RepID=H1Y5G0_9SPHI|nr:DUF2007 domain-containing protein [Mucilaginibacter paludis]EHQ29312.1 hypothetical protein Mucpa_5237 [Mucilaginibacter paludis DSM 18603]